ncbi:flagellar type III secretion system pore protein FliP [Candidatus Aerophobetes bacterium]|nr:flagellar type III secretion system pore protein FliP [Candidatus Aerophobetes bacterium]
MFNHLTVREKSIILFLSFLVGFFVILPAAIASPISKFPIPKISIQIEGAKKPQEVGLALQILFLLTILSLAPAFIIMVTSFTRIIVIFSFLRHALSTQQMPPNQILIGLALFLTIFVMAPTWGQVKDKALEPYLNGQITQQQAWEKGIKPVREFMLKQTRKSDLALFINLSKIKRPKGPQEVPTYVLIPAFTTSELKTAFQIGFVLYIPFLIIDIVISSIIMSMGMFMLPPILISLPFKILLFVLVDGWDLVIRSTIMSFR